MFKLIHMEGLMTDPLPARVVSNSVQLARALASAPRSSLLMSLCLPWMPRSVFLRAEIRAIQRTTLNLRHPRPGRGPVNIRSCRCNV
jgi:hypothetical protein